MGRSCTNIMSATETLNIRIGTVQGTPVLGNFIQEIPSEQAILQEYKMHFSYLLCTVLSLM